MTHNINLYVTVGIFINGEDLMKILCHFMQCKWILVTDFVSRHDKYNQPIIKGLWKCKRCGALSIGQNSMERTEKIFDKAIERKRS